MDNKLAGSPWERPIKYRVQKYDHCGILNAFLFEQMAKWVNFAQVL